MRMHGRRWLSASYAITMLCAFLIAIGAFLLAPLPVCMMGGRTDIGCARGFQTREGDQWPFRWSDDRAWITLPGVSWSGPQALSITLAAPRPQGLAQPIVTIAVADLVATFSAPRVTRRYSLVIPPPSPATGTLTIRIGSETFVPPGDERDLGVAISEVRALPTTAPRLPGLMSVVSLAIIAAALSRLFDLARTPGQPMVWRTSAAHLGGLLIVTFLAALAVFMPMQVAPFIPGLAAILALAAWGFATPWTEPYTLSTVGGGVRRCCTRCVAHHRSCARAMDRGGVGCAGNPVSVGHIGSAQSSARAGHASGSSPPCSPAGLCYAPAEWQCHDRSRY